MSVGRRRDERKEQEWMRRVKEWQASGQPVEHFCEQRGIKKRSFYRWRRLLSESGGGLVGDSVSFLPVQIVPGENLLAGASTALEVVLGDGRTLRVARGFDVATLRQLLAVLEGTQRC
jgi:hypothetical protein